MSRFHRNPEPTEGGSLVRNIVKRGFLSSVCLCSRTETPLLEPVDWDVAGGADWLVTPLETSSVVAAHASL